MASGSANLLYAYKGLGFFLSLSLSLGRSYLKKDKISLHVQKLSFGIRV